MSAQNDPFLQVQARLAAQEYVLKIILNSLLQLHPRAGLEPAMRRMLDNSVNAANYEGDPQIQAEMRKAVQDYGHQILSAGFGARPAS